MNLFLEKTIIVKPKQLNGSYANLYFNFNIPGEIKILENSIDIQCKFTVVSGGNEKFSTKLMDIVYYESDGEIYLFFNDLLSLNGKNLQTITSSSSLNREYTIHCEYHI